MPCRKSRIKKRQLIEAAKKNAPVSLLNVLERVRELANKVGENYIAVAVEFNQPRPGGRISSEYRVYINDKGGHHCAKTADEALQKLSNYIAAPPVTSPPDVFI